MAHETVAWPSLVGHLCAETMSGVFVLTTPVEEQLEQRPQGDDCPWHCGCLIVFIPVRVCFGTGMGHFGVSVHDPAANWGSCCRQNPLSA